MSKTPIQTIIDATQDAALNVYATNNQTVPAIGTANVVITNTTQYITEVYNLKAAAAGNAGEIEFNNGSGLAADSGLTYDADTDSLTVSGNVFAGNIRTDNIKYANGTSYVFGGSNYSNGNVASYLPTYTGTFAASSIVSTGTSNAATFNGSGAGLTNLPAANVIGTVANANYALYSYLAYGVDGANVTGTVANANYSLYSYLAYGVAGANVTGTVSSATTATTATTVTANSQPNITTVGTLSGLVMSGSITTSGASPAPSLSGFSSVSAGNLTGTLTTNAQPNITSVGTLTNITVSGVTNLGAIGNVHISGGTTGQTIITDGSGNLSWTTPASSSTPTLEQVAAQGASSSYRIDITNDTQSIGTNSGALKVAGGVGIIKDVFVGGHVAACSAVFSGQFASYSSWVVPKFVGRDAGATYIQGALINTSESGSADWVAYGDNSPPDGSAGWMDMGFTGSNFSDPLYTITKANDGYIFSLGLEDSGGNLVIATGSVGGGTDRDIIFATGGFLTEDERMRLNHEDSTLYVGGHAHGGAQVTNIDTNGDLKVGGDITVTGNIMPSGNVAKDIGSPDHRFKDLYLSGTTINLGGTLIQAQSNGQVSIGNATFSSSGTINSDSISRSVRIPGGAFGGSSENLQLSDAGGILSLSGLTSYIAIPVHTVVNFPIGTTIDIISTSSNCAVDASAVTLHENGSVVTQSFIPYGASKTLYKLATDTWYIK
jgi:hypothetical protein